MDVLEKLNQACREIGVCEPGIKHAAELWKEGSPRKIIVACWEDGCVSSCVIETESDKKECCYTAEKGGPELYWAWVAHLASPELGYKERRVEVEKEGESEAETERLKLLERGVVV